MINSLHLFQMEDSKTLQHFKTLLIQAGIDEKDCAAFNQNNLIPIKADGSTRCFFRLAGGDIKVVGVLPPDDNPIGLSEAKSAFHIGSHLYGKGLPVPKILGFDEKSGLLLFEDCGDCRLHDIYLEKVRSSDNHQRYGSIDQLYEEVVVILADMNQVGAENFDTSWCYDTPFYDKKLMYERESLYFYNEFLGNLLGKAESPEVLDELRDIVNILDSTDWQQFFLHRDFQSRNIMVFGNSIKIIDFQGGRLGPSGYDLASLLIDPYCSLPDDFQERLLKKYIEKICFSTPFEEIAFEKQYKYLKIQRNFQILGAFSFLYKKRGKAFFKQFIEPSLRTLSAIMSENDFYHFTSLRRTIREAEKTVENLVG